MGVLQLFVDYGGLWFIILLVAAFVSRATVPKDEAEERRFATGAKKVGFGVAAAAIAAASVTMHFLRLRSGSAFVPWSGGLPWVHTVYGLLAVVAVVLSLVGYRCFEKVRPWLSLGLVSACILGSNATLRSGPERAIYEENPGDDRRVVLFVQERLVALGCFAEAREDDRTDGEFDASTASAINSFQLSNDLMKTRSDEPFVGAIRPQREFRLLTSPFPGLSDRKWCLRPKASPPPPR